MHNVSTRANTIVTFAITVLGVLAGFNAISCNLFDHTFKVNAGNFKASWAKSFDNLDEGLISVDLTHDVSGMFNWNVKQIFMFVSMQYNDTTVSYDHCAEEWGCRSEVVIWDTIITRDSPHTDRIKITANSRRECPNPRTPYCQYYYNLKEDRGLELRAHETMVKVSWSVMPTCGYIWDGQDDVYQRSKLFNLPDTESKRFDMYNFRNSQY